MSDRENRRSMLVRMVLGGCGVLAAGVASVFTAAVPRAAATTTRWRKAASMFDLPPNKPLQVVIAERHADGWYETRQQTVVFIDRDGSGYRALSASCTHLGCGVSWDDTSSTFRCPCHGGVFARDGKVLAGPPPRPLDRYEARVNKDTGDIEVQW
jgi:Rieske Fe-S protein